MSFSISDHQNSKKVDQDLIQVHTISLQKLSFGEISLSFGKILLSFGKISPSFSKILMSLRIFNEFSSNLSVMLSFLKICMSFEENT